MKEVVLVPKDRLGVIKSKKTKEELENLLNVKLSFIENSVEIDGEGIELFRAKMIVKAIGRGFSPPRAFDLINEEKELEIIDISKFSDKKIGTIRSRIIGTNGKTRKYIEDSTNCFVSVYGKTISIIGTYDEIKNSKEAIGMIIDGARHVSVYNFLDKIRPKVKKPF